MQVEPASMESSPHAGNPPAAAVVPAPGRRQRHDPALDGVRGLAILIVMVHHHTVMGGINAVDLSIATILHLGGVGLFFVLSGYLITGILADSKGGDGYFRSFYARRSLRIFPLYYALLVFALVILPQFAHAKSDRFGRIAGDEWSYWVFLQNYTIAFAGRFRHAILDVTWTLAIEEQFYLLWPLVVWAFSRKAVMRIALALMIAALATRMWMTFVLHANPIAIFVLTPTRMDTLAAGAWLALWARGDGARAVAAAVPGPTGVQPSPLDRLVPWAKRVGLPAGIVAIGVGTYDGLRTTLAPATYVPAFSQTIGYTLWVVWFASIVLLASRSREGTRWRAFWTSRFMCTFGKYSYGLYLFHIPIRAVVRDVVFGPATSDGPTPWITFPLIAGSELPAQLVFFIVTIPPVLAVAWLSYHIWEQRFMKLRRWFPTPSPR